MHFYFTTLLQGVFVDDICNSIRSLSVLDQYALVNTLFVRCAPSAEDPDDILIAIVSTTYLNQSFVLFVCISSRLLHCCVYCVFHINPLCGLTPFLNWTKSVSDPCHLNRCKQNILRGVKPRNG